MPIAATETTTAPLQPLPVQQAKIYYDKCLLAVDQRGTDLNVRRVKKEATGHKRRHQLPQNDIRTGVHDALPERSQPHRIPRCSGSDQHSGLGLGSGKLQATLAATSASALCSRRTSTRTGQIRMVLAATHSSSTNQPFFMAAVSTTKSGIPAWSFRRGEPSKNRTSVSSRTPFVHWPRS